MYAPAPAQPTHGAPARPRRSSRGLLPAQRLTLLMSYLRCHRWKESVCSAGVASTTGAAAEGTTSLRWGTTRRGCCAAQATWSRARRDPAGGHPDGRLGAHRLPAQARGSRIHAPVVGLSRAASGLASRDAIFAKR